MSDDWKPNCSTELIYVRAKLLHDIRAYFYAQNVLEVETPVLCHGAGTDPYLEHFHTDYALTKNKRLYLQTSPEFAMKRLLSANPQSIYQICKAFRQGEAGRFHNPEFSLLEWYRVGFNLQQLMDDVERLLNPFITPVGYADKAERISYRAVFAKYTGLDALRFDGDLYMAAAEKQGFPEAKDLCATDHAAWLDFLFSHCVQAQLGKSALCMVYDYPACLPSLARVKQGEPLLVERVELFLQGIELGNGYYELSDALEQKRRFEQDILLREKNSAVKIAMDKRLLAALQSGLPDCSGIAIGLDRLLMVISQTGSIDQVLAFSIENA
ncbi:MAG: EF-P lysine aminoacylase GenX [Methyloprofundus sp.]|nr:EF-P lysine aminoacylase GenX [Methyloprofundus sp.]